MYLNKDNSLTLSTRLHRNRGILLVIAGGGAGIRQSTLRPYLPAGCLFGASWGPDQAVQPSIV